MKFNKQFIVIVTLMLLLLLSISCITASNDFNETKLSIDETSQNLDEQSYQLTEKAVTKKWEETPTKTEYSNYIYVNNTGNSSSNGNESQNPTTLTNAIRNVQNNDIIILEGNDEETYYNITENIIISNLNSGVNTFTITSNNNVILNFFSNYNMQIKGNYNIKISNMSLTRNYASANPIINNNATLTIDNCSIYNVKNTNRYGTIYNTKTINLNNSRFFNNTASRQGGVICTENATVNIYNSTFTQNSAENGAVLSSMNSRINIYNSTFSNNNASFGGVYSIRDKTYLNVESSQFTDNHVEYNGGVTDSWYSSSSFNDSIFKNNSADYGGVIYSANNDQTKITNSLMENNIAYINANNIYTYRDNLIVDNNVVLDLENTKTLYCYNTSYKITNNWWGTNNPDFSQITNNILPENWRIMTVNVTEENSQHKITVSLNQLSDSKTTNLKLYTRPVYFESADGTYQYENMVLENNVTNYYTGDITKIMVTLDYQTLTFGEKTIPYMYLSDINTRINDNATISLKCNPDITDNITLKVNDDFLTNITPNNGTVTFSYVFNSSWAPGEYILSATLQNNSKYADTMALSCLKIDNNYNTSVTLVSGNNNNYVEENVTVGTRYDLTSALQYQTSVKDQASSGSCWAFSTIAALEAAYKKAYGIEYNFSENNMKNILKKYSTIGDVNDYPNGGNNELEPISYLVGWYGPVSEDEDVYDDYSIMSPFINNTVKVEDVYFIYRNSYVGKDNKAFKEAIMKYGALASSIYSSYSGSSREGMYTTASNYADHAITIVGWNDFYNNFYGSSRPSGAGAYIIKNSWGTSTGVDGYQYVSYYDTSLAGVNINSIWSSYSYAFPVKSYENYTNIYQHDTVSTKIQTLTPSAWIRNIYTATSDESIAGVGTYIYEDTDYEAYIYVNDKHAYTQKGTFTQAGYRIIKLDQYIPVIWGDTFRVDLKLKAKEGDYTSVTLQNTDKYKSISKANQSFISTDGENWQDLYTSYDNKYSAACLKVYTKQTPSIISTINQEDNYNITTRVMNLDSPGRLSYKINDEYYTDPQGNIVYTTVNSNGTITNMLPLTNIEKYEYNITVILETENYNVTENITMVTPVNLIIWAENVTYYIDEEQKITANLEIVNNFYNQTLNDGTVLLMEYSKVVDTCEVINNTASFILNESVGTHNYTLSYRGSYAYSGQNVTLTMDILKHDLNIQIVGIENNFINKTATIHGIITYADNNKIVSSVVLYTNVDGKSYNVRSNNNGEFTISHPVNHTGNINYSILIYDGSTYNGINFEDTFPVYQNIKITVQSSDTYIGEVAVISGKVTDSDNNNIINEEISLYVNDIFIQTVLTDEQGEYSINYSTTQVGQNNITITYLEEDNITLSQFNATFNVTLKPTNITIDLIEDTKIKDYIIVSGQLTGINLEVLDGKAIKIIINDEQYDVTTVYGNYSYSYQTAETGINNVTVLFDGDDYYLNSNVTTTFNVSKIISKLTLDDISDKKIDDLIIISGTLADVDGNYINDVEIVIEFNKVTYRNTTNNEGKYCYSILADTLGTNNISVVFEGNYYYTDSTAETNMNISKLNSTLTLNDIPNTKYDEMIIISGTLVDENSNPLQNENLTLIVNNEIKTIQTNREGNYNLTVHANITGKNNITVTYNGNNKYDFSTVNAAITVEKSETHLSLNPINTVTYLDNINISGKLYDIRNKSLADKTIKIKAGDDEYIISTDEKGTYNKILQARTTGSNNITITFDGDNNYVNVYAEMIVDVLRMNTTVTLDSIQDVTCGNNITITGKLEDINNNVITDEIMVYVNRYFLQKVKTNEYGEYSIQYAANKTGQNNITVQYFGNDNYTHSQASTTFNVNRIPTKLTLNDIIDVAVRDNITLSGQLVDMDDKGIPYGSVMIAINGEEVNLTTDEGGMYQYSYRTCVVGLNNVTVLFVGDTYYLDTNVSATFNVTKIISKLTVNIISDNKVGELIMISGSLSDVGGNRITDARVIIRYNDESYVNTTNVNGEYSHILVADTVGINNISVIFEGDYYYANTTTESTVNIGKLNSLLSVNNISNTKIGENVYITGTLLDEKGNTIQNEKISITINNDTKTTLTNNEGKYNLTVTATTVGTNNITLKYDGNKKHNPIQSKTTFTTIKQDTILTIAPIPTVTYEDNITITGTLKDEKGNPVNAKIVLTINNKTINITTANGIYKTNIKTDTTGTNNITATYPGSTQYNPSTADTTFTVNKQDTLLSVNAIQSNTTGITITGKLMDKTKILINMPIGLTINNNTINLKTDSQGIYYYNSKAIVGLNNISVKYDGNNVYNPSDAQTNITINKQDTILTINTIKTTTYKNNVTITGTLKDNDNNVLKNEEVTFTLNNETFLIKTDNKGIFTYDAVAASAGMNNVTATYPGSTQYNPSTANTTFTVNKQNLKITFNPIKTVTYGHNVTITGTFTDGTGNVRANSALRIYINGKGISTRADANGRFEVVSKVGVIGVNNVTANHTGDKNFNPTSANTSFVMLKQDLHITVNPIQSIQYGNNVVITGTFTDGDGNPRANNKLNININGRTGSATTDNDGNYTFVSIVGKLGVNNVTVSHSGGANYNPTSASTTYNVSKQDLKITLENIGTVTYGAVTIKGKLTDAIGNIRANTGVKLLINGKSATAKTDKNGDFSFTTKVGKVGINNVTASHNGGGNFNPTRTDMTFNMVKQDLVVTIDPISTVTYGNNVVITGTFTDGSGKVRANSAIRIIINGKTLTTRTDANGKFRATSKVGSVGINNVTVAHSGGTGFNPTSTSTTFTMIKQDLKITINTISSVKKGNTLTITGTFTDANGKVRANTNLKVNLNGKEHTTKTDNKGVFTFTTTATAVGTNTITISHNGGANYNPTSSTKTFTVTA